MKRAYRIMEIGNPVLRAKAAPLPLAAVRTPAFRALVKDMFKAMHAAKGIGLAAPQIGKSIRLAVIEVPPSRTPHGFPKTVLVNPVILSRSKKTVTGWEGCLSFPPMRGIARRYAAIKVSYCDARGRHIVRTIKGFPAVVFQHEIDHLNGIIYVDRLTSTKTLTTEAELAKRMRGER